MTVEVDIDAEPFFVCPEHRRNWSDIDVYYTRETPHGPERIWIALVLQTHDTIRDDIRRYEWILERNPQEAPHWNAKIQTARSKMTAKRHIEICEGCIGRLDQVPYGACADGDKQTGLGIYVTTPSAELNIQEVRACIVEAIRFLLGARFVDIHFNQEYTDEQVFEAEFDTILDIEETAEMYGLHGPPQILCSETLIQSLVERCGPFEIPNEWTVVR